MVVSDSKYCFKLCGAMLGFLETRTRKWNYGKDYKSAEEQIHNIVATNELDKRGAKLVMNYFIYQKFGKPNIKLQYCTTK